MHYTRLRSFHAVANPAASTPRPRVQHQSTDTDAQVGDLEENTGSNCFVRRGRRSRVERAGRAICSRSPPGMFSEEDEAVHFLEQSSELRTGNCRSARSAPITSPKCSRHSTAPIRNRAGVKLGNSADVLARPSGLQERYRGACAYRRGRPSPDHSVSPPPGRGLRAQGSSACTAQDEIAELEGERLSSARPARRRGAHSRRPSQAGSQTAHLHGDRQPRGDPRRRH